MELNHNDRVCCSFTYVLNGEIKEHSLQTEGMASMPHEANVMRKESLVNL